MGNPPPLGTATGSAEKTCAIPSCGKPVGDGRERYCSGDCMVKSTIAKDMKKRRTGKFKHAFSERKCDLCPNRFQPTSPRSKYCSDACKAGGLKRVLDARKREREERRAAKGTAAKFKFSTGLPASQ